VPRFEPFRALRYTGNDLTTAVAPPYDVLTDADVDALQAGSPHNITVVDVPRGGSGRYDEAARVLDRWRHDGVLALDDLSSFTIYRLRFPDARGVDREIVGVIGGLEVVDEGAGGVLPHERTTLKASTDRLDLTRATRTNLSPVWGLSLAGGLTGLLAAPGEPVARVVDGNVEHVVERVTDPERLRAIATAVAADDVLIADGHHRYGISRTYRDEERVATGRCDTAAEQTLTFVSELAAEQLSVDAIHRLYADVDLADLLAALDRRFSREPVDPPGPATLRAMETEGFLVLVTPEQSEKLGPRPGAFDGLRALDGLWLEDTLSGTGATVTYQHGLEETLAAVATGQAVAAVLIRPVGVAEIERTAREGLLMPPKSTFFTPKLKTGFVLRPLD